MDPCARDQQGAGLFYCREFSIRIIIILLLSRKTDERNIDVICEIRLGEETFSIKINLPVSMGMHFGKRDGQWKNTISSIENEK